MSYENPIQCKYCHDDIYFDDEHISDSGKKIPMDAETEEPHHCPGRQYTQQRTQAFHEDQNYTEGAFKRDLSLRIAELEKRVKAVEDKTRIDQ